jgi:predicted small lipoprotein YifL
MLMERSLSGAEPANSSVLRSISVVPPHTMRALLLLIAVAALSAGCGYKGPLFLPKPKPEAQKKPATPPVTPQKEQKPDA